MKKSILIVTLLFSAIVMGQSEIRIVSTMEVNQMISIKGDVIKKTESKYNIIYDEKEIKISNTKTNEEMKFVVWMDEKEFEGFYMQGGVSGYMQFFQPKYYLNNKSQGQIENIIIDSTLNKILIYQKGDIMIFSK
ncbi:hypothetical protein [Rasiella sp. SM2506]|uniref:hypothetical protein n=1 Tax=Rasiella sp. SM2506 TaxID=3423914 RepID=UPI003D7A914C